MKKLSWLFLAPLAAGLILTTACGETTDTPPADGGATTDGGQDAGPVDCTTDTMLDISGVASVHPVSVAMDSSLTIADMKITLADPLQVLSGRTTALKLADCADATMDLSVNTGAETTASFSFIGVDTKPLSLGLVATLENINGGSKFVTTTMGIASMDTLTTASAGDGTVAIQQGLPFAVSVTSEAAFAALSGKVPGDLTNAGWLFGMFIDAAGAPVDAVTLIDTADNSPVTALYPAADFSAPETDGDTSPNGIWVVSGLAGLTTLGGTHATMTCATQSAATVAGRVFVVMLVCQ